MLAAFETGNAVLYAIGQGRAPKVKELKTILERLEAIEQEALSASGASEASVFERAGDDPAPRYEFNPGADPARLGCRRAGAGLSRGGRPGLCA